MVGDSQATSLAASGPLHPPASATNALIGHRVSSPRTGASLARTALLFLIVALATSRGETPTWPSSKARCSHPVRRRRIRTRRLHLDALTLVIAYGNPDPFRFRVNFDLVIVIAYINGALHRHLNPDGMNTILHPGTSLVCALPRTGTACTPTPASVPRLAAENAVNAKNFEQIFFFGRDAWQSPTACCCVREHRFMAAGW